MRKLYSVSFALFIMLFSNVLMGATFTAVMSGDWDDGATWGNVSPGAVGVDFPAATDDVIVPSPYVVTMDQAGNFTHSGRLTVEFGAGLIRDNTAAFIYDGPLFDLYGDFSYTFIDKDLRITGNGVFHAHNGATVFISDDFQLFDNSLTIIEPGVCIGVDDDFSMDGPNCYLCGGGGASVNVTAAINTIDFNGGATAAQICTGTTVYRGPGGNCNTVAVNGTGPIDSDNDGFPDNLDLDDDNDGILDVDEVAGTIDPSGDEDGDGTPNYLDTNDPVLNGSVVTSFVDSNGDGVNDKFDQDLDGFPNHLDVDSDQDGLADGVEANGGTVPAGFDNATGQFTGGVGGNGLPDDVETTLDDGLSNLLQPDTDSDGLTDHRDIDADNDGITDNIEGQSTAGYIAPSGADIDGNGRDDVYDNTPLVPVNSDAAADNQDYRDLDTDDDGVPDIIEGNDGNSNGIGDWDANSNGTLDAGEGAGTDTDGDGLLDPFDPDCTPCGGITGTSAPTQNTDFADDRDWRDTDDDNDGIATSSEDFNTNNNWSDDFTQGGTITPDYLFRGDADGDGILNSADLDDDNDGIVDSDEVPGPFDPSGDEDADGVPNYQDTNDPAINAIPAIAFIDANGDGVNDNYDADRDGIPNHQDVDADNDGIADGIEANGGATPASFDNSSGRFTGAVGTNGLPDAAETAVDNGVMVLSNPDTDTDGLIDLLDIDADGDGITDNHESQSTAGYIAPAGIDGDGNGRDDAYDASPIFPVNTESTGLRDYRDTDSDDDGVPDNIEGHDGNQNGIADNTPAGSDTDGDGLDDAYDIVTVGSGNNETGSNAARQNTDFADDRDWRDTDDDNDGTPTSAEDFNTNNDWSDDFTQGGGSIPDYLFRGDVDGDGIDDGVDLDDDNDGITDVDEVPGAFDPGGDEDADGIPNYADASDPNINGSVLTSFVDSNSDGINDKYDTDLDGIPNHLDIDADNDGIADAIEANDGVAPASFSNATGRIGGPVGANGLPDAIESSPGVSNLPNSDTDADGIADALDIDADDDGITDNREGQSTAGYIAPSGTDTDGNGRDDAYDSSPIDPVNTEAAGNPDYLDLDSDGDGVADATEGHDANSDGIADRSPAGTDTDGDGLDDNFDTTPLGDPGNETGSNAPLQNTDGADDRDWRDTDDDNDGILTSAEDQDAGCTGGAGDGNWANDFCQLGGATPDYLFNGCSAGEVPVFGASGNATGVTNGGAANPGNATGAPDGAFANLGGGDDVILNLGTVIPAGQKIVLTLARTGGGTTAGANITSSLNAGGPFANLSTYASTTVTPTFERVVYNVPTGGIQFILIEQSIGNVAVDAVQYSILTCDEDFDGDGVANSTDLDDDNDGIRDDVEGGGTDPSGDLDTDGIPNYRDTDIPGFVDNNGDGINDNFDFDQDGIPNHQDVDADNDGIADGVEANGGVTPTGFNNSSGFFSGAVGANGMPDDAETAAESGVSRLANPNADGTGLTDFLDIDADDDGIPDNIEVQSDAGYVLPSGTDADGNGRDDSYDGAGALEAVNTDLGGNPDYTDTDSDDDGVPDSIEGHDNNQDGVADVTPGGMDTDGDGLDNAYDIAPVGNATNANGSNAPLQNTDLTDNRDWRDTDDDNDGLPTSGEDFNANLNWADDFTQGGPNPDYLSNLTFPVEILSFEAVLKGQDGVLDWSTVLEINNSHFTVQRSVDGLNYEDLDQVQGLGNSTRRADYQFVDPGIALMDIDRFYYRLEQVDLDGNTTLIGPKVLTIRGLVSSVKVYPNPSSGRFNLEFFNVQEKRCQLRCVNLLGQTLFEEQFELNDPFETRTVNLEQLSAGVYQLFVMLPSGTQVLRIIIE